MKKTSRAKKSCSAQALALLGLVTVVGCAGEGTKAARPPRDTLGRQIFGVLCERVGAQSLREDLTGASYDGVCHGDAMTVAVSSLPPAPDADVRAQAVAKVEALARHRNALIAALEVVFPDDAIAGKDLANPDEAASCNVQSDKPRRDQLRGLLTRLLPADNETVPESSRAMARAMAPLLEEPSRPARIAMARLAARRGYMPPDLAAGLVSTVMTAPRLRDTLGAATRLFSPDASPYDKPGTEGVGHPVMRRFFAAAQDELNEAVTPDAPLQIAFEEASGRTVLSRPRTSMELVQSVLLSEDPAFSNGPPLLVARRDRRGVAVVAKVDGKLPAPFVDKDGDGLPDLDALGRFAVTGKASVKDPFVGDDRSPTYEYVDARSTAASALLRHISPLADPDGGSEAFLNAVEGFEPLLRAGGTDALLDLVHAAGQLAADPAADEALALVAKLFKVEPQLMARVTGNLLDAKATLDAHPEATIPDKSTLVDDLLAIVVKMGNEPGLLEDVLVALGDDRAALLGKAMGPLMKFRDRITYDRAAINGPPMNATIGRIAPPETPVDRTKPNTGPNRSIFKRFLQLLHDTRGVTACSKDGGILHSVISLDGGETYVEAPFPFGGTGTECSLLKIENLSTFYLRSVAGYGLTGARLEAMYPLQATLHFRNDALTPFMSADVIKRSTGLEGVWPSNLGEDVRPRPELLNRLVFFDVLNDSTTRGAPNYRTNFVINELQGPHIGTSVCAERTIPDPNLGDPDVARDGKVHGLRTCAEGQWLDQRDADTLFALEYNKGYEALAPLAEVFLGHKQEGLLLDLLDVVYTHWNVEGGVVEAEPALAEILATDLVPSLGALTKVTAKTKIARCPSGTGACPNPEVVPAMRVLADGLRAIVDPARAKAAGTTSRKGKTLNADGKPLSLFSLFRDALRAEDAILAKDPAKEKQWTTARSRVVDEFLTVEGRGEGARFRDAGIPQIVPVIVDLLRAQRLAKCQGEASCPALQKDLVVDVEKTLTGPMLDATLDLLDVVLADPEARREVGRLTAYLTRQDGPLGGTKASASSNPFTTVRGPGVLDQSIAGAVDALGALGDLKDVRALYPTLAHALGEMDPQLSLLSRLNARAFDAAGREICARELDPEEAVKNTLARLALPVTPPGEAKRTALQIFLDAIADVNRIDPARKDDPLAPNDYANVFTNVHELLTDPTGGLEQLYASVREATKH